MDFIPVTGWGLGSDCTSSKEALTLALSHPMGEGRSLRSFVGYRTACARATPGSSASLPRRLRVIALPQFRFQELLQSQGVRVEVSDAFVGFFGRHGVLVHQPPDRLLVEFHLFQIAR